MPVDSLNDQLNEQFDQAFGSLDNSSYPPLPIRTLKKSREVISTVTSELSNESTKVVDYQGFVRFLSTCPAPVDDAENVEIQGFIGSGWTMSVYRGKWKTAGKDRAVAVKQLNMGLALGLSSQEELTADLHLKLSSVILEIRMMSHELLRNHRNIVRLLGIIWHEQESTGNSQLRTTPSLLVELAASADNKSLTLETIWMSALHALGVVHGDVKPENILLFEESDRLVAKISDFGFWIAGDDDLKSARGGIQYWNAPECLARAPLEIRKHHLDTTRDYFSYGLVIWFVLFEELPFDGTSSDFNAIKLGGSMKDRIDDAFFSRYRVREADLSSDSAVASHWCQERYNCRSEQWMPCIENRQHVLRFLMQWVLVSSPPARRWTFDLYRRLLDDESSFNLGYCTFQQIGAWDIEWEEFGTPQNRLRRDLSADRIEARQKTLYAIVGNSELEQWGRLRSYENTSSSPQIHNLQGMQVPVELQKEIFQQSLTIAKQDSNALDHIKIVAESYAVGFGTEKDLHSAFQCYKAAAEAGDIEASVAILQLWSLESTYLKLGAATYCLLLSQALMVSFGTSNEANTLISHSAHPKSLEKFQDLLSKNPDVSRIPMERAFQVQTQQSRVNLQSTTTPTNPTGWIVARDAIQYDDQDSLRTILRENPELTMGRPDGIETLTHVAIRYGRAGLLRILIQEFNINLSETNSDGSTPLSFAIKVGSTSSMRVLLFADNNARVAGDDAAMDNASEGKGDLTRLLYEKFVDLQQEPNETDPSKDRFLRWSFFSLASAVLNNNWGVFCTLLDIGVDPSTSNPSPTVAANTFFTATMLAATTYNPLMLTAALAFGSRTQTRIPFPDSQTALHLACGKYQSAAASVEEDDMQMIREWSFSQTEVASEDFQVMQKMSIWALVQYGADIETKDYHGYTPLAYALAECPDFFAAKILLELDPPANINAANFSGNTVLHEAVREGDLKRLEFCLNHGASLEQKTELGETALAIAVKEGHIEICHRLLLSGASITERDENGQNCLTLALQKAQFEILAIFKDSALLKSPQTLFRLILDEDCRGWTGLHTCIMLSPTDGTFITIFEKWLDLMLEIGDIDLDHQDLLGWTLLHTAVASSEACARILLEHGATTDIKDSILGWTPLHHAFNDVNVDMWNLLLEFGADPYISDDLMGWTPLVVLEQAMDKAMLDESEDFESTDRESQARRRARLRECTKQFVTEKSLGRMVRPIVQADLEWKEEANRRKVFPDEPLQTDSGAVESVRELRRYFLMDNEGSCKEWGLIEPSQPSKSSWSWQAQES